MDWKKYRLNSDDICEIQPKTKFKSLGILFSTIDDCTNDNIHPRVRKIRNIINMWKERDLSIKGRITLIKSLIASQLTYCAVVIDIPRDILKTLDREIISFMWRGRPPKVKRSVICQPIERGGLGAVDIASYVRSIQLSWTRRMLTNRDAKWRVLLQKAAGPILLEDLLRGNMSQRHVESIGLPNFYSKIIAEYYRLKPMNHITCATDIYRQCLWYNAHIQIDHKVIFFLNMYRQGIKYVGHIFRNGDVMDYNSLCGQYPDLTLNPFAYQCLKHAIPREWKTISKAERNMRPFPLVEDTELTISVTDTEIELANARCKHFYRALIPGDVIPTCKVKWSEEPGSRLRNFHWGGRKLKVPNLGYSQFCFLTGFRPLIFHHSPDARFIFFFEN